MLFVHRSSFRCSPEVLFRFHERPDALALLSPRGSLVRVVKLPASLQVGEEAILRMGLGPFRLTWVARHTVYEPPHRFVDEQVKGPFRKWRHEHRIEPHEGGAELIDAIEIELPAGGLGDAVGEPLVRRMLESAFAERHRVTRAEVEKSAP